MIINIFFIVYKNICLCYNLNGDNMEINKIVKMKDNKYKIYIEDESIITYDNVILENDLLYKKNVDSNLYKKIILDTEYYDVYNKSVKYILKKKRSENEIYKYLKKFDIDDNKINKIVNKLKDLKLINDLEYCKSFINDKIYLSKCGINKIRIELLEQNIPYDIIEEELKKVDTNILNERLEKLILKKINSNKKHSNYLLKQKILNEMINLGYDKNNILEIIDNNLKDNLKVLNNEFDKIYLKFKNKYSGIELQNKLKQKLIQKGFNIEDINKLLKQKTEE